MKCYYSNCPYGGHVEKEEAIKSGKKYYHKDCFENKELRNKFMDICHKYIIPKTNESDRMAGIVLAALIKKEPDIRYLVFMLCQIIRQNKPLNSVMGLHYYLNQFRNQYKINILSKPVKIDVDKVETEEETKIEYKKQDQKLWGDILQQ